MSGDSARTSRTWQFKNSRFETGRFPLILGILNVTPDSFSDGGSVPTTELAVQRARLLVEQGADILDVGGESTRPGAARVSQDEELRRVVPVIECIARELPTLISIDTTKAAVAKAALQAGASIVNDISGLQFDPAMPEVCATSGAGVICMHIQGTPQTMQLNPHYTDVVTEICDFLKIRLKSLESRGIPAERIVLDPGVGFGKTAAHNLEILANISRFRALGRPVCVGHSRKRFLQKLLGRPVDERTFATVGISLALAFQSTDIIRVHDVAATRDALLAWQAIADRIDQST